MARILLVEDSEVNWDMLSRRLRREGYEVLVATDGKQGVELALAEVPDLILMDMSLPILNGWEATRQIRAAPQTRAVPIIALTAHTMRGDREKALGAGCDDYDTKPIEFRRLLGKMQALLEKQAMSMTHREPDPRHVKAGPQGGHASIRHELGTPLNAIIGYAEILLESAREAGREDLVSDLEKIRTAGKQLVALLRESAGSSAAAQAQRNRDTIDTRLDFALRTPLNAIMGYTDMLLEDAEDQDQQDWIPDLQRIRTAAERFLTVLRAAADSASLEVGMPGVEPETPASLSTALDETSTDHPPRKEKASLKAAQQGNVLVVDDIEANRTILSHFLEQRGHRVAMAENGRQALGMLRLRPFDLVLLDVIMPEIDGYEVLQRLKSDDTWRDIPVIMISALDEIDSVVRCIELGAEDYLPKPFDPVLLNARISASLEKKWLRDLETEYLRNVARVTTAAAAVEAGEFEPESLEDVAERSDGLGQLARVFQSMAREVFAREQRLKQQIRQLRIELDTSGQARQVAEITETEYFRRIQGEAQELRSILDGLGD